MSSRLKTAFDIRVLMLATASLLCVTTITSAQGIPTADPLCLVTVYCGNGIMTLEDDASFTARQILPKSVNDRLLSSSRLPLPANCFDDAYAKNNVIDVTWLTVSFVLDIAESADQIVADDFAGLWRGINGSAKNDDLDDAARRAFSGIERVHIKTVQISRSRSGNIVGS